MNITNSSRLATLAMTTVVVSCASLAFADVPQLIPAPRKLAMGEGEFVCQGDVGLFVKYETDASIPEAKPGFADFKKRAAVHRSWLVRHGVNCAPLD